MDQNVEFAYRGNVKAIKRLNDLLGAGKFSRSSEAKESLEKQLRHKLHVQRGLEEKLWCPLYDDEGYFPTGLLPYVHYILEESRVHYEVIDERIKPEKQIKFILKETFPPLRYYQKEAYRKLSEQHRGVVEMPTGTGKSLTAARMIWELGLPTLIITPGKSLTDQMTKTLVKHFGKGKVKKLTTKDVKLKTINVVNIQALVNMDPKIFKDIRLAMIDEFHHAAADTYLAVNEEHLSECYYRIGFTATNFRNDGAELALRSVLSEVLHQYSIQQAIEDGFLMKPEFVEVPIRLDKEKTYQTAYKKQIVQNKKRNQLVKEIAEDHPDDAVIILVKQVAHGELLKKMLPDAEFIHGEIKDGDREKVMEKFRKGQIKRLIGTSVIGEGVDLPVARVLILAAGGKARGQVMQNIGRVLRLHPDKDTPIIYDFTDEDGSWLESHSEARFEVYDMY